MIQLNGFVIHLHTLKHWHIVHKHGKMNTTKTIGKTITNAFVVVLQLSQPEESSSSNNLKSSIIDIM